MEVVSMEHIARDLEGFLRLKFDLRDDEIEYLKHIHNQQKAYEAYSAKKLLDKAMGK